MKSMEIFTWTFPIIFSRANNMNTKSISSESDKHLPLEEKTYTLLTPNSSRNWRSVIHIIGLARSGGIMVGTFLLFWNNKRSLCKDSARIFLDRKDDYLFITNRKDEVRHEKMKLDKLVSKITYFPSNFHEVAFLHNLFLGVTKLFNYALVHWAQNFDPFIILFQPEMSIPMN